MTSAANPASWTVVSQRETMEQDPASGTITAGWRIYFQTGAGQSGSVFVPNAIYQNVDTVKQMIADQVKTVTAVGNLNG